MDERTPLVCEEIDNSEDSPGEKDVWFSAMSPSVISGKKESARRRKTGQKGEAIAAEFLRSRGYVIRGENIRLGRDEIDLLAHDPTEDALVFVEVKTRSKTDDDFRPELNVDARKKRSISRAARTWVAENKYDDGYRLDLICVAGGKVIEHIKELDWGE
jgi:putative endonuclease